MRLDSGCEHYCRSSPPAPDKLKQRHPHSAWILLPYSRLQLRSLSASRGRAAVSALRPCPSSEDMARASRCEARHVATRASFPSLSLLVFSLSMLRRGRTLGDSKLREPTSTPDVSAPSRSDFGWRGTRLCGGRERAWRRRRQEL